MNTVQSQHRSGTHVCVHALTQENRAWVCSLTIRAGGGCGHLNNKRKSVVLIVTDFTVTTLYQRANADIRPIGSCRVFPYKGPAWTRTCTSTLVYDIISTVVEEFEVCKLVVLQQYT